MVWASNATFAGSFGVNASSPISGSISTAESGASASEPIASSWPSWPTVDDVEALCRHPAHLVVHLGHEWANGVDEHCGTLISGRDDLRCRAVGGKHDRAALGDLVDIIDKHHAGALKGGNDRSVVNDLVIAVHRPARRPGPSR